MQAQSDVVDAVIARRKARPEALLQILIELQQALDWLPAAVISRVARALRLPRARVEGVASFYRFLHLTPAGHYRVLFSDNIVDRMAGSQDLMALMCRTLWLTPGRVSDDGLVSVDATSCTGMGDQSPAMLVNGHAITRLDAARVQLICDLIQTQCPLDAWPSDLFVVSGNVRRSGTMLGHRAAPGAALRAAIAMGRAGWLAQMEASGLRGRGGAGFVTAHKWRACREAAGAQKVVVCNADEGEPGTFKDRVLLAAHADDVIEGMTLAAWAVGAQTGLIYLRGEYRHLLAPLEATLARRRAAGWLGRDIAGVSGFDFDVEIHLGAGAYIWGEESALLESLEGKRGTPRIRPPYPVTHGYLGRPTVVNNVETLALCCHIALDGGDTFAATGTAESTGTKLMSVSGDCARPGIYEYPFGVSVRQVLEDCGAQNTQAVQVGGASGMTVAPAEFDRVIAFEDVPSAGAFMIFDSRRDMFEVARSFVHFFAHESCGFCTPCRVGTALLAGTLDKLAQGYGGAPDLADIDAVTHVLRRASHCGLGRTAANPVIDGLHKFREVYDKRMQRAGFTPAFDVDGALARSRQTTGRDDAGAHLSNFSEDEA